MTDSDNKLDADFEFSRQTYYELINLGKQAIQDMIDVAQATEHPRSYEVLGNMIKQIAEVNDKLMDVNKKRADIKAPRKGDAPALPGNTNIFVGSTTELQRYLIDQQKQKESDIIDVTDYREDDQQSQ